MTACISAAETRRLQSSRRLKACSTLGVYCLPGDEPRRIRLRRVEVREFPAFARLLPDELDEQALALTGDGSWTLGRLAGEGDR